MHLHANNNGQYISFMGKKFCSLFEMTFALRSKYTFTEDYDVCLPLDIDSVNTPSLPEIALGRWNEHVNIGSKTTVHVYADMSKKSRARVIAF